MNYEGASPFLKYKTESGYNLLRVIITPFNNYKLFKAFLFIIILVLGIMLATMLFPVLLIIFTPFGKYLIKLLLVIIGSSFIPVGIIALLFLFLRTNKVIIDFTQSGIKISNNYWVIEREAFYFAEKIKNIRISENISWGAISFDYENKTIDICQSLSKEDAKQIIILLGENIPEYKPEIDAGNIFQGKRKLSQIQSLGVALLLIVIIGGFGTLVTITPNTYHIQKLGLIIVWIMAIGIGTSVYINSQKQNWISTLVMQLGITILLFWYSIYITNAYYTSWIWIIIVTILFILAWILPIINMRLAENIYNKQKKLSNKLNKLGIGLFTCIILLGIFIPRESYLYGIDQIAIGIYLSILAIGIGQKLSFQINIQRKNEKTIN